MIRELIRLAWRTLCDRRPSTPDRPGSDDQFSTWPNIRVADYLNPEDQQDQADRRWKP